jgi:hypothetical protein
MKKQPKIKEIKDNIVYFDDGTQWTVHDIVAVKNRIAELEEESKRLWNRDEDTKKDED